MEREDKNQIEIHEWPEDQLEMYDCPSPDCRAHDMMFPVRWERANPSSQWRVMIRCTECETYYEGLFDERQIGDFDDKLDEGTRAISEAADRLTSENMGEFVEMFSGALRAGEVYPEDFRV